MSAALANRLERIRDLGGIKGRDIAQLMGTTHWTWSSIQSFPGVDGEVDRGKRNVINNFCIAVSSNWPRCTSCHAGYGWEDGSFDFSDESLVDCLVCHDQSGQYEKASTGAGHPADGVDPWGDYTINVTVDRAPRLVAQLPLVVEEDETLEVLLEDLLEDAEGDPLQVMVLPESTPPSSGDTAVSCAGTWSVTVTFVAVSLPLLATTMV